MKREKGTEHAVISAKKGIGKILDKRMV